MRTLAKFAIFLLIVLSLTFVRFMVIAKLNVNIAEQVISKQIKASTGRTFDVHGDITISAGLVPKVTATKVTFSNASWGTSPYLATADKMVVYLNLIELLVGEVNIRKIKLSNVELFLERNEKGEGNWEITFTREKGTRDKVVLSPLSTLITENAKISYIDKELNQSHDFTMQKIRTTFEKTRDLFRLKYQGTYNGKRFAGRSAISWSRNTHKINIKTNLLGGVINTDIVNKFSKGENTLKLKLHAEKVNAGSFLKLLRLTDSFEDGELNMDMDLVARMAPSETVLSKINGTVNLFMNYSYYNAENKPGVSDDFLKLMAGTEGENKILLNCFLGEFELKNGLATTEVLVFDAKGAFVLGEGDINLDTRELNITLTPKSKGVGLASLAIPMKVSGELGNPTIGPEGVSVAKGILKTAFGLVTGAVGYVAVQALDAIISGQSENPCLDALKALDREKESQHD